MVWGLSALLLAMPLAVGAVEPWAYAPVEAVIFVLIAIWMAQGLIRANGAGRFEPAAVRLGGLIVPMVLLIALIGLQLIPLPPGLERRLSPATFSFYQKSLPGWPAHALVFQPLDAEHRAPAVVTLPTVGEVAAGAGVPFHTAPQAGPRSNRLMPSAPDAVIKVWRTLSVAPSQTAPALLKLIAYAGLFLMLIDYPFQENAARQFAPWLGRVVVLAGLIVAAVALLERIYPNGRALWLFQPYDWPHGNPWATRAVGSFANPDHLANYLNLTLPFAIMGVLRPAVLSRLHSEVMRVVSLGALILVASALLLSSSRGGWLGAMIALVVLGALWPRRERQRLSAGKIVAGVSFALFLVLLLLFVGPQGRTQADARLKETVTQDSLADRLTVAAASLGMVRDFPLFGVGLGAWPQVFPRYSSPPWSAVFWNATHNDYVELLSETGILGFAALSWFFVSVLGAIWNRKALLGSDTAVIVAACVAGMSAAAFHEFFDFSLQAPANAVLFIVLVGIAIRLSKESGTSVASPQRISSRLLYGSGLAAAAGLALVALAQRQAPYPYDLKQPKRVAQAYALINAHPANAEAHLALASMLSGPELADGRMEEIRTAVWLDPANPLFRDLYAQALFAHNKTALALKQITRSVSNSPELVNHFYLNARMVPWLAPAERRAIAKGFNLAVDHRYSGAVENFASYEDRLGDTKAEAAIFEQAAQRVRSSERRAAYFENAGNAYLNSGEPHQAAAAFNAAIAATPTDSEPYARLIIAVLAPAKKLKAASLLVSQGIAQGADPYQLDLALAAGAQSAGDFKQAQAALKQALAQRPTGFEAMMQLGLLDLNHDHPDRAAVWFRRATQLRPGSAEAFSDLGRSEEAAYEYFTADQSYRRALVLAPADSSLKANYAAFRQKLAQTGHGTLNP